MKYSLDNLVVSNERMFVYGWIFDPNHPVCELVLQITYEDGACSRLPVNADKERADVAAAFPDEPLARWSGWMAYVGWDRPPSCVELVATLTTGEAFRFTILGSSGPLSLSQRLRQFGRKIFRVCNELPVTAVTDDVSVINTIRAVLQAEAIDRLCLVLDHFMGGGANHYRRDWIRDRLAQIPIVAVLGFDVHEMTWILELHMITGQVLRMPCSAALPAALAHAEIVGEVFLNDAVSFPRPELVPQWLQAWAKAGAQITIAVHDYLAICSSPFLLNDAGRYCGVPSLDECRRCLQANPNTFPVLQPGPDMVAWRQSWRDALMLSRKVLCFSDSSRRLLLRAHPTLDETKISVTPHQLVEFPQLVNVPVDGPLHVGVVGAIGVHKGASVLHNLVVEAAKSCADLRITVFGTLEGAFDANLVTVTGTYQRDDLPSLIERSGANVFLLPSICPETFSYVTHELISLRVPLACFDLGAPADRVHEYPYGRVLTLGDAKKLLKDLIKFHSDLRTNAPKENT